LAFIVPVNSPSIACIVPVIVAEDANKVPSYNTLKGASYFSSSVLPAQKRTELPATNSPFSFLIMGSFVPDKPAIQLPV
jgi:hypothetical protein